MPTYPHNWLVQQRGVVLHAGLHKTGSSSIQYAVRSRQRAIAGLVATPIPGSRLSSEDWRLRLDEAFRVGVGVISDENFLGAPASGYAGAIERARLLAQAARNREYRLVIYVRPHTEWLESVYLQEVQEASRRSPTAFLSDALEQPLLRWSRLRQALIDECGSDAIDFRPYRRERVVEDFLNCALIGSDYGSPTSEPRLNQSITPIQAPLLQAALDDECLDRGTQLAIRGLFQNALAAQAPRGFSVFSRSQQLVIAESFRPDWIELTESVRLKSPDLAKVFGEMVVEYEADIKPAVPEYDSNDALAMEIGRSMRVLAQTIVGESGSTNLWHTLARRYASSFSRRFRALRRRF